MIRSWFQSHFQSPISKHESPISNYEQPKANSQKPLYMNKFPEAKQLDFPALEKETLAWWKAQDTFAKELAIRKDAPTFTFYEGPPTANGRPGIHHVLARTIKDTFCRYQSLKGHLVERKAGWDTHGLPVEIEVEKALGLASRSQVEEYGIAKYNAACKESVLKYTDLWYDMTIRMGYWCDLENPYVTFHAKYMESVWWILKQFFDKGLLYQGYKIQWYSPGSNTVLSSHEVSLGYKEVQDPSVYVRFKLKEEENTYFLAWTTTPWTLISNMALAVGPKIKYVKVKHLNEAGETEYLILAEALVHILKSEVEVIESYIGSDLVGKKYEALFPYFCDEFGEDAAWRVIPADYVSVSDGTGIVHIAPAFGADDYENAKLHNIPLANPIERDGTFNESIDLVAGLYFKDANKIINRDLKERGLLFRHETYLHNYPHDWRKGTPLMQYPVESWFIRTSSLKEKLVALNKTINWQPESIGTGRFGQWLENNVDWALSRSRYWGTPLPLWMAENDPSYVECIGSIGELREKCGDQVPANDDDVDLHRPFVDEYTYDAPSHIGGKMRRVPDLIDVWFDSGAMPFAQWHYPFENKEKFEANFPAQFIAEGVDQTRGWFYSLHAIATLLMDGVSFQNVISGGLLLDKNGEKMSKSKGNTVDPFVAMETHGADPIRWYFMSASPPWMDVRYDDGGIENTKRKFFGTLSNTYTFFAMYANVDGFSYNEAPLPLADRSELDRWIISRLNTTIQSVDAAFGEYNPTKAARAIELFTDELSNWYVRRSRRRFWRSEQDSDKVAAFQTMYECLLAISKMMSPIAPFYGEWLYRALNETTKHENAESVHHALFPEVNESAIDLDLEHKMGLARTISSIVLALRNEVKINVRQPLGSCQVVLGKDVDEASIEAVKSVILDEVNIKNLSYITSSSAIVKKSVKPNFRVLGKKVGALMKATAAAISHITDAQIEAFEQDGSLNLTLADGNVVNLTSEDLDVLSEGVEGWLVGSEDGVTVALDANLTDELRTEGLAREFVNRVQNMRKAADFEVTDRIHLEVATSEAAQNALRVFKDWIQSETLALDLAFVETPSGALTETFDINEYAITIGVRK